MTAAVLWYAAINGALTLLGVAAGLVVGVEPLPAMRVVRAILGVVFGALAALVLTQGG